jgi:hypothetical protein
VDEEVGRPVGRASCASIANEEGRERHSY